MLRRLLLVRKQLLQMQQWWMCGLQPAPQTTVSNTNTGYIYLEAVATNATMVDMQSLALLTTAPNAISTTNFREAVVTKNHAVDLQAFSYQSKKTRLIQ